MRGPAITQTTCPGCGAPIRIDVWAQVHKCRFCGQSSFVHRPKQPLLPPPPGQENFRHIHVTSAAVNKSIFLIVILVFVGFNVAGGVITALVIGIGAVGAAVASRAPAPTVTVQTPALPGPPTPTVANAPAAGGPSCQKLVRCCKVIQPENGGCEVMAMIGEAECARQLKTFEDSAWAMRRRCD